MKKVLLFIAALLMSASMIAQTRTYFISEHFNGASIPAGWQAVGTGATNWSVSTTQNAGGNPNELMLNWSPQFNGTARMVMPAVDLTGVESVVVSFKHALDNYTGSHTIGIATSSDNGATWNVGWQQSYSSSNSWSVIQTISTADMGNESVQFSIFYTGNSYNINYWYFDDIEIFSLENLDLGIVTSNIPNYIGSGSFECGLTVFNYGVTPVTSVEATYTVEGKEPVTQVFDVNITSLNTAVLTFDEAIIFTPGEYVVDFSIDKVNGEDDDLADNNTLSTTVTAALASVQKVPMIEHFSSSTCGPCVQPNNMMHTFCNNNPGRYTYTKYQMNWPGNGDPYYTAEGGTRRTYYGVNAVPMAFLDAEDLNFSGVQNQFNQHADQPAFMDIRGSFTVNGDVINVKVDAMPYMDVNARLFVSVNEKETHNNVGSNGETTFHHIFMKMLTPATGQEVNFAVNELQHFEFSQNMSGTHVEEMTDLEVSIWVQVYSTKEIFNSHFAYEYTEEHPYPVQNLTMVQSKDYTLTASWDAPEAGTPTGYDVYLNGVLAETTTATEYSFISADGNFEVVGVVAKYADEKSSVMSVVSTPDGPQDLGLVPEESLVELDPETQSAVLRVTNTNDATQTPIVLNSVEEVNDEGVQYLVITCADLPMTLNYGEDFEIRVEPNVVAKGVAETTVVLSSEAGDVTFIVKVDGELLSVSELSSETKIYPNPTTGNFVVEGLNVAKVEVFNLVGQKVYEAEGKSISIDANHWNKGIYMVNVTDENGVVETQKLLVK